MITSRQQEYFDKNTIVIESRDGTKQRLHSMLVKDGGRVTAMLPKVLNLLMLNDHSEFLFNGSYRDSIYETDEQLKTLNELLPLCLNGENVASEFDIRMAKAAVLYYIQILGGNYGMVKCGEKIIDRDGNEYMAYSFKLSDYDKAMELLQKVDTINTINNCNDGNASEAYKAMIEIIYMALDKNVTKQAIRKSMDAEFARKAIRIYYDLPQLH